MPFLMESHLGGHYDVDDYEWDDTYCETCGDSDWPVGWYDTDEERQALIDNLYDY